MPIQLEANVLADIRDRVIEQSTAGMPERIGRYRICGELGRGGMGVVYDAYDERLERAVALKVVHPDVLSRAGREEFSARFEREMKATSGIFHPNLVSILDGGVESDESDTWAYYVMERIVGPSLEERLLERGRLTREQLLEVGAAVARGLAAAHANGLVHRDLKASNVLLPLEGEPKVADFGLCNVRGAVRDAGTGWLGSAHSMAPEQIRSEPVEASADLFALGTLLVRASTGTEPFRARSLESHFYRVLHDAPDGLDALDPALRRLVSRLLAKRPDERPASAGDVARELAEMASGGEGTSSGRSAGAPPRAPRLEGNGGFVAVVATLLVVAACGFFAARAHNELVTLELDVQTRWKQVEVQLTRQHELIPRLLEVAERHIAYESDAIERVARVLAGSSPGESTPRVASELERALLGVLVLAERIPALSGDEHFQSLAYEIAGSKNRIAVERARYNEAVGRFNQRIEQFPSRLWAGSRSPRPFFSPSPEQLMEPSLGT